MSILTNLLSLLGNNKLISAVIPSLAFLLGILTIFDPIIKTSILLQQPAEGNGFILVSLLMAMFVIILSYILIALNPYLLKIFEGYIFSYRLPFLLEAQKKKASKLINKRDKLKTQIEEIQKSQNKKTGKQKINSIKLKKSLNHKLQEYYSIAAAYDENFPPTIELVMPTTAGNFLRASAAYAGTRYGIDHEVFWPRLFHVIPKDYKENIDSARNELTFLFNSFLLTIIFYFLCVVAILQSAVTSITGTLFGSVLIANNLRYIGAGIFALALSALFNNASLYSAKSYGALIRSAYDLFRLDLLDQFRLQRPKNSIEEFYVWKNLGELLILGQDSIEFKPLIYKHNQNPIKK